ncbi:hypothetical protein V6Z11_A09G055400 [Gossypium hirsutum]|uniref:Uncharacterized protein isoform X2 n=1 Tax=Gossypium hirsutum TaxID=3635 RepID=A0ABM2YT68_GOSHI|nr:uncharacterized protein LOC107938621 isoform X2 [Gossypium hirsutum]
MFIGYCFLLLLQLLVQLKLPFNLRINIWYYRAPELIFGATKYTTAIDICSRSPETTVDRSMAECRSCYRRLCAVIVGLVLILWASCRL